MPNYCCKFTLHTPLEDPNQLSPRNHRRCCRLPPSLPRKQPGTLAHEAALLRGSCESVTHGKERGTFSAYSSTDPSGNLKRFCTTEVSSRMRRPFSPRQPKHFENQHTPSRTRRDRRNGSREELRVRSESVLLSRVAASCCVPHSASLQRPVQDCMSYKTP